LRVSLKGNAAYIIDDENLEGASYKKVIKCLKSRFGLPESVHGKKRAVNFLVDTGCERLVTPRKLTDDAFLEPAECRLFAVGGL